jgi:hypothetical protein
MTRTPTAALVLVLAAGGTAHADKKLDLLFDAGRDLRTYYRYVEQAERGDKDIPVAKSPDDCVADVKKWQARGIKDGDVIRAQEFDSHPNDQPWVSGSPGIKMSDMKLVCEAYRKHYPRLRIPFQLEQYEQQLKWMTQYVKPEEAISYDVIVDIEKTADPAGCKEVVAAARADDPARTAGKAGLSLDDYEATVCGALAVEQPKWVAAARAAMDRRVEAARAPYIAVGIDGDKLDLLAHYHGGIYWTLKGGGRTDDPAVLAKTSVLFNYLVGDDPERPGIEIHTVRKHQFKGNKLVKRTEKQYRLVKGSERKASWFK